MKKIISIGLIILILFNTLGFYGLFVGIRYKVQTDLMQRLNKNQYSENETITIKIPFTIPYQIMAGEYERVDGEIEHDGQLFRLVKQKLERDTLFVVCIKDDMSMHVNQTFLEYLKALTDNPVSSKQSGKILNSLMKDYLPSSLTIYSLSIGWNYTMNMGSSDLFFYNRAIVVFSPPPQV